MHRCAPVALVVDDDRLRRIAVTTALKEMGYRMYAQPEESCGHEEQRGEPDVVLMSEDVLRVQDEAVVPRLLQAFSGLTIVLGSEHEEVAGVPYLEMGADAYLPAPLDKRMLLARLKVFLRRMWQDCSQYCRSSPSGKGNGGATLMQDPAGEYIGTKSQ